jgi:hypothetical protein
MRKVNCSRAKIFKIKNRKGYACICLNHLTEGKTPYQAYLRMVKAQKRSGNVLAGIDAGKVKKLMTNI